MAEIRISETRDKLDDLAGEQFCVYIDGREYRRTLSQLAEKVVGALSEALTFAEELREQGYTPVESVDRYASFEERVVKAEQRRVAELLEHKIRKALED